MAPAIRCNLQRLHGHRVAADVRAGVERAAGRQRHRHAETTPALSVAAQPMPSSPRAPSSAPIPATPANGDVYLEVTINGESTKEIAHFVITDAMIYTTANELRDVGIRTDDLPPPGENGLIALGTIPRGCATRTVPSISSSTCRSPTRAASPPRWRTFPRGHPCRRAARGS
ncbi:hypothetical protein BZM27_33335 [Paraburkholderia steynii]|uniref:Uncharacterized protein n=1 Tax=Paraburkholderia steynii TaxID=1245441 RepID=A0A4R0X5Q0_9BURK|nr:hypothetical protein BZM27_33335 [Paraburkholderia steynii]